MSAHRCRHCHAVTDFIHIANTKCPECAPVESLTQEGMWYHCQTIAGAIADRRAAEGLQKGPITIRPKDEGRAS